MIPDPPHIPNLGVLCGRCFPTSGCPNTLCVKCLNAVMTIDDASVEFSHKPSFVTVANMVIPRRYHDAEDAELLPGLRDLNPLTDGALLYGEAGRGKTYQAALLVRKAISALALAGPIIANQFQWHSAAGLLEQIRNEQRQSNITRITVEHLIGATVLVIDDLGAEKPSEWVRERMYEIVNARYEQHRQIIVTTNLNPAQLEKQLGARIAGRLMEMCLVAKVEGEQRRKPVQVAA